MIKKDYTTIALVTMMMNAWKQYKTYEAPLVKHLESKGFIETNTNDAQCFISDYIISDEDYDAVAFEKDVEKEIKQIQKEKEE